ncbi:SprT-like domain-containing protein [Nanoarchaeota archaeon]
MNIIEEAFRKLYPNRQFNYTCSLKYSGRFSPYNANIQYAYGHLQLKLSKEWKKIGREIKIGLIQSLMAKLWKTKQSTLNIDFYNNFIKKIHLITAKVESDPRLEESFNRVNEKYFSGLIERPNLVWGRKTYTKLGSYDLQSDKISISLIFDNHEEYLDYVMYHELLHKKHKFYTKGGRSYFHTHKFKQDEKKFERAQEIEEELKGFLRGRKRKRTKSWKDLFGF